MSDVLGRVRADLSLGAATGFARLAADYLASAAEGAGPVSPVASEVPAPPLPVDGGADLEVVLADLRRIVVDDANRLWHPMYMGHQVGPGLPAAVWAESVVAALNQSIAVREMSPAATPIEYRLIDWMCGLVWGEPRGRPRPGGTFTSGGTEAIFTSLLAARNAALPESAVEGVRGPAAIVCGEHAHYAVRRAAAQIGLGSRGSVAVRSAARTMDVEELERTLDRLDREGVPVVAVVATAGSTATGSFDDLGRIGRVCDERSLWLHVDAAHGGSALLSPRHRHRVDGIGRADSVSWDAHKMMLAPLAAGVVLVRDERRLEAAFAQDAPYLFHAKGEAEEEPPPGRGADRTGIPSDATPVHADAAPVPAARGDQGLRSFMCSRRADAVKVWVALRRYGPDGIASLYDGLCERAAELYAMITARDDFQAMHEPECNILCFRWVGDPRLDEAAIDDLNLALRERWNASGRGWITTTVLEGTRVLRIVVMNPLTTADHLRLTLDGLASMAAELRSGATGPAARATR